MSARTLMCVLLFFWMLTVAIVGAIIKRPMPELPAVMALVMGALATLSHASRLDK
jgi:hypothetical protein